jgi:transposase-like protein
VVRNLNELMGQYSDEGACRKHLAELRWPDGVRCLRCNSRKVNGPSKRHLYECDCGYQFSVKVGTVFNDSKVPLQKWFVATYLICESQHGVSAKQLERTLGVSYKTAWYLGHRIRSAMADSSYELLTGTPDTDPAYAIYGESRRRDRTANTAGPAPTLFERALIQGYHTVSVKHLPAYLAEFEFRFNNRNNPGIFRDTLRRLTDGETLTYRELTE